MGGTQETSPGAIQRRNLPKKTCAAVCVGLFLVQLSPEDFSKYKEWLLSQQRDVKTIQDMPKLPVMAVDLQHIRPWWPEQSAIGLQVFEYHWPSHYVILEEARHEVFLMNVGD